MKTADKLTVRDFKGFRFDKMDGAVNGWLIRRVGSGYVRVCLVTEDSGEFEIHGFDQYMCCAWSAKLSASTPADIVIGAVAKACE